MKLGTGKPLGRREVMEVFAPHPAGIRIQVRDMELDVACVVLVDGDWSCCFCHVLSVEPGTDIFGSIGGRVRILGLHGFRRYCADTSRTAWLSVSSTEDSVRQRCQ